MPIAPEQLDLSKSAETQEKFRTRRVIPWEAALLFFYILTFAGFIMAIGLDRLMVNLHRPEFLLACALFVLFGITLVTAMIKTISFKRDYDQRRAILVAVLAGSNAAELLTDAKQRTIYANTKAQKLLKNSATLNMSDLPLLIAGGVDDVADSLRNFIQTAKAGVPGEFVYPYRAPQHEAAQWARLVARPLDGWRGYVHWRVEDISSSYTDQQNLLRERTKLIEFLDHAPVGFFSVDEKGVFLFANDTLRAWLGAEDIDLCDGTYTLNQLMLDRVDDLAAYDVLPQPGDNPTQRGEIRLKGFDERVFQASITHTIIKGPDGTVRTRSIMRDLTPERAWKKALQQSEDRFQRFFEEAPLGIALVDQRGQITEGNSALADMLGLPIYDLLGKNINQYMTDEDNAKLATLLQKLRDSETLGEALEITLKGSKNTFNTQMFATPFMGEAGVVLHFIDVTEQKNLESKFTQSQKMQAVGQLAGGIAHDFNNLLTAMIGFCDLLLMRHKAGDSSFADIMQIKQNANRAANLVRQLLAFSRQQTLQPKTMDLADVVTEVSHLLRRLIGANIDLKINHERDLGLVRIDQGQMEQVLVNLAVNARDAMSTNGVLTINTANYVLKRKRVIGSDEMLPGNWVALIVTDTGTGMPAEIMNRNFDPFFSTKEIGAGTGLGLSTVYGIVRQSNGFITVDSQMGVGTTFTIYLPQVAADEKPVEVAKIQIEEVQDLTGTAQILLVEDEDAVRAFSSRALTNKGYQVLEATSGEHALEVLEAEKPNLDLLITDVIMPQMDGIELLKRVRETRPALKVIVMSGYTEDKFKGDMGPDVHFLPKPFSLKQLAEKVKEALG